jgi:hypothetical protein
VIDLWEGRFDRLRISRRIDPPCRTCVAGEFPHLAGSKGSQTASLCGRNAVQVTPATASPIDLEALASRLGAVGEVTANRFLVRARIADVEITVFGDGRAIVAGTNERERAKSLYSRYVGH